MVEFSALEAAELSDFRSLSTLSVHGTLGLITVNHDVFLCVVSGTSKVATVRPGETIQRILAVEFREFLYASNLLLLLVLLLVLALSKS